MATSTFYPAYDGAARWYDGIETNWTTVRGKTSATDTYDSNDPQAIVYSTQNIGPGAYLLRSHFSFDTSALPDSAVITSATLSFYGTSVVGTVGAVCVQESTMASNTALVAGDFDNFNTTELASRINITSWSTSGYNDFALNSSGLAIISKTGYTKFCLRHSSDVDNSAPASTAAASASMSEHTGTSQDPKLVITYSLAGTTSDSWAWSDSGAFAAAGGNTLIAAARWTFDTWAWSDTTTLPAPAARTAGTRRTIFAAGGSWHYQFPSMVKLASGRQLCLARKATGHSVLDGVAVSKYSDDSGATWSSETVVTTLQAGQDDYRGGNMQVLAGGRVGHTFFTADYNTPVNNIRGWYSYSDDNGATWSTPVQIDTAAWDEAAFVASDLVQLGSGRIVVAGFGRPTFASSQWSAATVYSDDNGATWADLGTIAAYGTYSFNVVEPQIERFETGKLFATYHTEDSVPTNFYRTTSTDGGATWASGTLVSAFTYNRQGISTVNYDRGVIITFSRDTGVYRYYESADYGETFASEVTVDDGTGTEGSITWAMPTQLAGTGDQQNVGFVYSYENIGQTLGSVYFKQFSGLDGTFTYPRSTSDAWAWSDSNTRSIALPRTTSDTWAWSDSAARGDRWAWTDSAVGLTAAYSSRTTSDTWAWTDVAAGTATRSRTTTDAWAWTDSGALPVASYYSRTTTDTWAWTDSSGTMPATIYWLRARRSSSMSTPTKTYSVVQAKGTTRTATWTSPTYKAETEAGILVVLDVTAASGTGGLTLRINAHDQASSQAVALNAAPTAVTATGTTSYALYPFGAIAGNVTQATSFYLPRMFSITVTHEDSSSYTYSLGYCLLP